MSTQEGTISAGRDELLALARRGKTAQAAALRARIIFARA